MIRTTRLTLAVAAVALAVSSNGASAAVPAPALVVSPPQGAVAGFATPIVIALKGQAMSFVNADVTGHTVTSKETKPVRVRYGKKVYTIQKPLFDSDGVNAGAVGAVKGVENLKPGTYHFYCSLHTGMTGELQVK